MTEVSLAQKELTPEQLKWQARERAVTELSGAFQGDEVTANSIVNVLYYVGVPQQTPEDKDNEQFNAKVREIAELVHEDYRARNQETNVDDNMAPFGALDEGIQAGYVEKVLVAIGLSDADRETAWSEDKGTYESGEYEIFGYNKYGAQVYYDTPDYEHIG
ncbi:MAG TPA: hypothetical protein PKD19_01695 [Candidatus Saccharibacteria bacterium]|nr:hypothetical protein [Candidatus Saccharibacteria bacterium]HMR38087.1 hypothetical protein [Candidatus Saccharibacteria bacterium]